MGSLWLFFNMNDLSLDIIIPVWNRPLEVRAALASFVAATPAARLVMVNNGSERETESILDEFAESLDDRALLVAVDRNIGSVAALNLGLSRATAALIMVTSPFIKVEDGWFSPAAALFGQYSDAGSVAFRNNGGAAAAPHIESDHGSFEAMIISRDLYAAVGGFDESMDSGEWALRDFARRSTACGYRTFSLTGKSVTFIEQQEMGSPSRREGRAALARESYLSRWGEPGRFLLNCPESLFGLDIETLRTVLLQSARQGDSITVTAESKVAKLLLLNGFSALHENVSLNPLPRFFSKKSLVRVVEQIAVSAPATVIVSETEISAGKLKSASITDLLSRIEQRTGLFYQRGSHDCSH